MDNHYLSVIDSNRYLKLNKVDTEVNAIRIVQV